MRTLATLGDTFRLFHPIRLRGSVVDTLRPDGHAATGVHEAQDPPQEEPEPRPSFAIDDALQTPCRRRKPAVETDVPHALQKVIGIAMPEPASDGPPAGPKNRTERA